MTQFSFVGGGIKKCFTVIELKNSHNQYITNFRHYLEEKNKRDLIMSISCQDNNIKIWNVNKLEIHS